MASVKSLVSNNANFRGREEFWERFSCYSFLEYPKSSFPQHSYPFYPFYP